MLKKIVMMIVTFIYLKTMSPIVLPIFMSGKKDSN